MSVFPARAAIFVRTARSSWAAVLALAFCVSSTSACSSCSDDPPATKQRPLGMVLSNPPVQSAAQPTQGPAPTGYQRGQQTLSSSHLEAPPPAAATHEQDQAATEKPARDYSAELSAMLSSAVSCLTGHNVKAHTAITINVSAQVMPSGTITRADAQGAGLTPVELSCIQKLVSELRLAGPIDGAPRSVSAHLTVQGDAAKVQAQPKAADDKDEEERDENPHDSKIKEVNNEPPEVQQRDEPVREPPEAPPPREEPPHDTPADEQP